MPAEYWASRVGPRCLLTAVDRGDGTSIRLVDAAGLKFFAVGEHFGQAELGSRHVRRQFVLVDDLTTVAAQPEDLGGLLRRDLLVTSQDADRLPMAQA